MTGVLEVVAEAKVVILVIVLNLSLMFLNYQLIILTAAIRELLTKFRYTTRSISDVKILFIVSLLIVAFPPKYI